MNQNQEVQQALYGVSVQSIITELDMKERLDICLAANIYSNPFGFLFEKMLRFFQLTILPYCRQPNIAQNHHILHQLIHFHAILLERYSTCLRSDPQICAPDRPVLYLLFFLLLGSNFMQLLFVLVLLLKEHHLPCERNEGIVREIYCPIKMSGNCQENMVLLCNVKEISGKSDAFH